MSEGRDRSLSDEWYQTIELRDGSVIQGKVDTRQRIPFIAKQTYEGKSVIDVGCSSGQFCLYAKERGASRVVGIDIIDARLQQAQMLAEKEGLNITYLNKDIFELKELEQFDIVFCFAVVTEISDLFGALGVLKDLTKEVLYLELDLAKPLFYLTRSRFWYRPKREISRLKSIAEVRVSRGDFLLSPTLEVLSAFFGDDFTCEYMGPSVRYDMVRIRRKSI
ncbi:MAG TPA: class I SAM-dependent methyltransferase [Candidatus Paceibacterota bacterium]|nr:class I SAM-dependent methyltransferase [Candidatus Paceibacterota bacterium]